MTPHLRTSVPFLSLFLLASAALADEPKKDPDDKQVVGSKVVHVPAASSVRFQKELGLPFSSLGTLGSRIDAARRAYDPVSLAHAASELAVAEKVSGKKASLTSTALVREAAALAKLRSHAAELQAVANVSDQVANEADLVSSLKKEIALSQARAKADKEAFSRNEQPTFATRKVLINNYTTQYLTIWVNGRYKTEIEPGLSQMVVIEHRWNPVILTANGNEDIDSWGPRYVWGRFDTYKWNIN